MTTTKETPYYDVIAVHLKTKRVRLISKGKTYNNAEAVKKMAVMRRGVEQEIYVTTPAGEYENGQPWVGGDA